jgi:two-component system CheB/CheR fusion protein
LKTAACLSANEELQSANEELASSKEETQSLNEELTTVNTQLEMKVRELQQSNDDLHNLLRNTRIACLFLDRELRIRRYTPAVAQLISIIPSDIGRPIRDFASPFAMDDLIEVTQQVLADLKTAEAEMCAADGRWYWRSVQPYESAANYLDGVVVTFTDITSRKHAEQGVVLRKNCVRLGSAACRLGIEWCGTMSAWSPSARSHFV